MLVFLQAVVCIWESLIPFYMGHRLCGEKKRGLAGRILWYGCAGIITGLLLYQRYLLMYSRWYLLFEILLSVSLFVWRYEVKWRDAFLYLGILYESIYVMDMFSFILVVCCNGLPYIHEMQVTIMPERLVVFLSSRGIVAGLLYAAWRNRKKLKEICAGNKRIVWMIPVIQHFSLWSCDIIFYRSEAVTTLLSLFLFVVIYMCLSFTIIVFLVVKRERDERSTAEQKAAVAEQGYRNILCCSRERDILVHDIRNHLIVLEGILRREEPDRALAYVEEMRKTCLAVKESPVTDNVVVDTLLGEKLARASQNQIRMKIMSDRLADCFVSDRDWCSILGNLLDNAIEASQCTQDRRIRVRLEEMPMGIVINVENSFGGETREVNGKLVTTKKDEDRHGIGLASVRYAIEKYEGVLTYECENNVFRVNVILYR